MINVFKKIWDFAYNEHGNIKKSIGLGLLNAIFHALQLYAIFAVLAALVNGNPGKNTALIAVGLMLVSIVGKIVTQYYSQLQRVHAGYFMAADKRIQIGDKLKVVPMGYFNQNSLGNITAVATTTLADRPFGRCCYAPVPLGYFHDGKAYPQKRPTASGRPGEIGRVRAGDYSGHECG